MGRNNPMGSKVIWQGRNSAGSPYSGSMERLSMNLFSSHFDHVEFRIDPPDPFSRNPKQGSICIRPVWKGVDRPIVDGYCVSDTPKDRILAERIRRAMVAGAFFRSVEMKTDVNGLTYISASSNILMRMANADLKRLGF